MSNAIHGLAGHSAVADELARIVATYLVFFGVVALAWLYIRPRSLRTFITAGLAAVAAVGIAGLIGLVDDVPRPFVAEHFVPLIQHSADSSFPSDHLAALGALCGATWFTAARLSAVTAVVAAAVAFARVYVATSIPHLPGDNPPTPSPKPPVYYVPPDPGTGPVLASPIPSPTPSLGAGPA